MLKIKNVTTAEAKCDVCGSEIAVQVFPAADSSQVQPVATLNTGRLSVNLDYPDGTHLWRSVELCTACAMKAVEAVGLKPEE